MQITIDTNNLSELDINMLAFLAEQDPSEETVEEAAPEPAKPVKAATKKAAATPAPVEEPAAEEPAADDEEDLLGGDDAPTMADAIARATELVSSGGAAKVKEALATVNVKRVSELAEADIATFLAALPKPE